MIECSHIAVNVNRADPTRTTALRNAFARDMNRRFAELVSVIRHAIIDHDCFGMGVKMKAYQMTPPERAAFSFARSSDKVAAFETWLKQQTDAGILEVRKLDQLGTGVESAWTNRYVADSYKRGISRARYEMNKAGMNVPPIEQTGGVDLSMSTPFHVDRLGLLYSRVYTGLKGITDAMGHQVSQVLTQGMADGDNPRLLARKLIATINGTGMGNLGITDTLGRFIPAARRAEMLARTEIIRSHHVATIQEYRNYGLGGVKVQAEWMTSGFDVCPKCQELQGKVFPLNVIESMIPAHPNCRCIALPVIIDKKSLIKGAMKLLN
jgi:SPP1 gp7 family putative phage head morphogenesis protein